MARKGKQKIDAEVLRAKLKIKQLQSEQTLGKKYPYAVDFLKTNNLLGPGRIREHATKLLTSGALASSLLLASPQVDMLMANISSETNIQISSILPQEIKLLTVDQEAKISHFLYQTYGIQAVPQLGSTRLNHVYGMMGAEQHLPRFPGDTISQHDEYQKSGITPGLGAWGYFTRSKNELTEDLFFKEKYYVAVQTLYLPDWPDRLDYLYDWYKYRKVVVVNPANGKVIVAVIADAGPAKWTGKQFGGSPEVMAYLGLNIGMQKGAVVMNFVDDPEDKVSLGPLENHIEKPLLLAQK